MTFLQRSTAFLLPFAAGLLLTSDAHGQGLVGGWQAMGPGPASEGQVENITPDDQVVGAIHTVAAHPSDADVLYVGGTNAGVWKTTNATDASPNWNQLTDGQGSMSIGGLAGKNISGVAARGSTVVVSVNTADVNSVANLGIWRSTNGGTTFTQVSAAGGPGNHRRRLPHRYPPRRAGDDPPVAGGRPVELRTRLYRR